MLTPRIITQDPQGLVDFIRQGFGAEGEFQAGRPTELRLGDSLLMVSDGGGVRDLATAFLLLHVPDVDAVYQRVISLGATSVEEPADQPWGGRRATVLDGWGNTWQIAAVRD
jgi:PhnB protein